jgi:hypothetical protein
VPRLWRVLQLPRKTGKEVGSCGALILKAEVSNSQLAESGNLLGYRKKSFIVRKSSKSAEWSAKNGWSFDAFLHTLNYFGTHSK